MCDLAKLNPCQISNLNRPITPCEVEAKIESLPLKKCPGPDVLHTEFYRTFKELMSIIRKLF